ncbi:MAG: class I SAM-dependent methyltransferase [Pirellulales bacterium]|nr:class I SAM-dependent methyltransferase [Pirellulales bacterium]
MPRRHLFEFTDLPWFPRFLRDAMTGYLEVCYRRVLQLPPEWTDKIVSAVEATGETNVLDLCSGAGGPMLVLVPGLRQRLGPEFQIVLSDLFPNAEAQAHLANSPENGVRYEPRPIDARHWRDNPPGVRTIVGGFHHFRPEPARQILAAAVQQRRAICVFEVAEHSWVGVLSSLTIPIMVLLLTPLVRPLRWPALVFTYLVPILPLLITWDGFVSQLRTYTPEEMRRLVQSLGTTDYHWDLGTIKVQKAPIKFPYLVGWPGKPSETPTR